MKMPLTLEMRGNEDYEIETKLEGTSEPGDELQGTNEPAESDLSKEKTEQRKFEEDVDASRGGRRHVMSQTGQT